MIDSTRHLALSAVAVATIAAAVGTSSAVGQGPTPGFEVGQTFPQIELPSLQDGSSQSLADFRGQKVLLHIFASW